MKRAYLFHSLLAMSLTLLCVAPARCDAEKGILLRFALLLGDTGDTAAPPSWGVATNSRLSKLLMDWDPASDGQELRNLLALKGLTEMARQAIELPPQGGATRGTFHVDGKRLDLQIEMVPRVEKDQTEFAEFKVLIYLDGELVLAPRVISLFGERATVSTSDDEGQFIFVVLESDHRETMKVARSSPTIERIDGVPLVDGELVPAPRLAQKVAHQYPDAARELGAEGTVVLRLRIDTGGKVRKTEIRRSVSEELDAAAARAAHEWRFDPPEVEGEPSEVLYDFAFRFVLNEG